MWDPYADFVSTVLPNGLTVHAVQWPNRSWESIGFMVHSGADSDPVGLEGVAHFLEHMTIDHSQRDREDLERFIEENGGATSFGTTYLTSTRSGVYVPAERDVLKKVLSFFGRMLTSLKFDRDLEKQRKVILSEFHKCNPARYKYDLQMREHKALFSGSGYFLERALGAIGNPESIERIGFSDLQTFYDTHYVPANISIVCVGGLSLTELVELISESPFGVKKEGQRRALPERSTDEPLPTENRHVFFRSEYIKEVSKVGAYNSAAKLPGNLNEHAVYMVRRMLREVLFNEIRLKRGWSYEAGCECHRHSIFFTFSIDIGALALDAMEKVEEVVEAYLTEASESEDLFNRFKNRAIAVHNLNDLSGRGLCSSSIVDLADYQRIVSLAEAQDEVRQVTRDDVREVFRWLHPERRWTLITMP